MNIPLFESNLPTRVHAEIDVLVEDMKAFIKTRAFNVMNENTALYGDYIAVGAQYTAYIFPFGGIEKLKSISRYYSMWALIDDQFFDNSVDLDHIVKTIEGFKTALNDHPDVDKLFYPIVNFCSENGWTKDAKDIFKIESVKYLDNVLMQRTIEVQKLEPSLEEYLDCRAYDVAMPVMFSLLWYLHDDLPAPSYYSGSFEKAFKISGYTIGLLLDLYSYKAKKKEIKDYAHAVKIIQRIENCDEQIAIDRVISLFYQYSADLEEEFNRLEVQYPVEVRYFRYIQSGSIRYCNENRKIRYLKESEADENLSKGRSIL
ncbi:terpene synthase family protein [Chryseobacterium indologenes]|uniref:terpene synthase family protein n=1 Tax=Chryseobacterium indologenes TaxID=253 RepID=UPI001BD0032E|nr:terpene synthase family protein [Chryseobacterium indologenes]